MTTCKQCGGRLGPHIKTIYFKEHGRQLYFPHDFARWHANTNGHDPDRIHEWVQSARGSKEGLVMGYRIDTGEVGHDGKGEFCGMTCAAEAATAGDRTAAASGSGPHARGQSVTDLQAASKIDGAALRSIRDRLQMSQRAFAIALGYTGSAIARAVMVSRMENGQRNVPERVQLRAAMLDNGAKEKGL